LITSEQRQHEDSRGVPSFEPSSEAGIARSLTQDVYVALDGIEEDETAMLRIAFNPLVLWIWIGGAMLTLGGTILFWPGTRARQA
jgi:cytochrome c-type biogenesis protein CcmF